MPSDSLPDLAPPTAPGRRLSAWLAGIAIAGLAGAYLLISPDQSGERIRPWPDESWMLQVVRLQALYYLCPTPRGVEIKTAAFHLTACVLSFIAAAALLLRGGVAADGRAGLRGLLSSPIPWFATVVVLSAIAAAGSDAPRAAGGGTVIRFLWFAWWWPLALCLRVEHARRLGFGWLVVAAVTAAVGLWYRSVRAPDAALSYPLGNPLFLAAMLMPAGLAAAVLAGARLAPLALPRRAAASAPGEAADAGDAADPWATLRRHIAMHGSRPPPTAGATVADRLRRAPLRLWLRGLLLLAAAALLLYAGALTGSRSAKVGFGFGLLAAVYAAADAPIRNWLLVIGAVVIGLAGGTLLLTGGDVSGTVVAVLDQLTGRSASIRARVEHEWPFAWDIFLLNPWVGGGEGAFGRLVGPLVRARQLSDPMILAADGVSWETHAHNELLETMTSLGAAGTLALLAAIGLTLRAGFRAADLARTTRERAWIIAFLAAFVAAGVEEMTDIALHMPGFAPVAMTIWACLWTFANAVLARSTGHDRTGRAGAGAGASAECAAPSAVGQQPSAVGGSPSVDRLPPTVVDSAPIGDTFQPIHGGRAVAAATDAPGAARAAMASRAASAAMLCLLMAANTVAGGLAVLSGLSYRRFHRADQLHTAARFAEAIPLADAAARWRLEPSGYLNALVQAVRCRVGLTQRLAASTEPADQQQAIALGCEALQRLDELDRIAPRYLQVREYEGAASTFVAQALRACGSPAEAQAFAARAVEAFRRNREDEPFRVQSLVWLWDADRDAPPRQRLLWLRDVLRGGEADAGWDRLLTGMTPAVRPILQQMVNDAAVDLSADWAAWRDPLSPESFRLAARASYLFGDSPSALALSKSAVALYSRATGGRAGSRFMRAHGAALHEQVQYAFAVAPGDVREHLQSLRRAFQIAEGVDDPDALPGAMGRTRLVLLLFAGDEAAAADQARRLIGDRLAAADEPAAVLADGYLQLAARFGPTARREALPQVMHWSQRAAELDPRRADAHRFTAATALALGMEATASEAIRAYRRTEPRTDVAEAEIGRLKQAFPESGVWGGVTAENASQSSPAIESYPPSTQRGE